MPHQQHTCVLPAYQQQGPCKACRSEELLGVGSWAPPILHGPAQGHIAAHAQQVPFDADAWLAQARGYPDSVNWWHGSDRGHLAAHGYPVTHRPNPLPTNVNPRPAPQTVQQARPPGPTGQAATQAPPQPGGREVNAAGSNARNQSRAHPQRVNSADARPRVFGTVTQTRGPASEDDGETGKAGTGAGARRQVPRTPKVD